MGLFDRFRSPEERARRAQDRATREALERETETRRAAERAAAARLAAEEAAAAEAARQRAAVIDVLGQELADMEINSAEEAKLAIKMARLRKRELQAEKRALSGELADHREAWRERQAGRHSTVLLGRGATGRMIRAGIQANRRSERQAHADIVNDFSDRKQVIDQKILAVDRLLLELERRALG
jgi:hypothetical protein